MGSFLILRSGSRCHGIYSSAMKVTTLGEVDAAKEVQGVRVRFAHGRFLRFAVRRVLISGNLLCTSNARCSVLVRHTTRRCRREMDEVLAEEQIQSPLQGDANLLFQARQLTQVDC